MPRCSHCGKVNRDGSLFCQDCGNRLEASATAKAQAPAGPVCAACGTANPAGMNFCKMCGSSLAAKPAPEAVASTVAVDTSAAPAKVACPACGKQTPSGFAFCQHCGQRLGPAPAAQPARPAAQPAPAASPMLNPTPPAGMRPGFGGNPVTSSRGVASEDAMAKTIAPTPEAVAQLRAQVEAARAGRSTPAAETLKPDTIVDGAAPARAVSRFGTLIAVNRDGSDGQNHALTGDSFDIGRTEGRLSFEADPYLAPRHARLLSQNGKAVLRPMDPVNGVYLRVQGTCELHPGDQFLVGKEVIRYEPCAPEERDPPSLVEHGVRLFGSAPREAWGRLRQISIAGTTRDVWHLTRPELVLGREEGDVTFPDDEFMSRRHAAVKRAGQSGKVTVRLEDLNSSNGTFVRLRGDRELQAGDILRMGDQLMRYEP
jgi:hypothetical protein